MVVTRDTRKPGKAEGSPSRKTLLVIVAGAACLGAAFLAIALLLSSCSGSLSAGLRKDGGARISLQAEVPPLLAAKFRSFAQAGGAGSGALFDAAAIRSSIAARPALSLIDLSQGSPDSLRLELSVRSLEELAASPDLAGSGLLSLSKGPGWAECRLTLSRGSAKALGTLFPGLDPQLMQALSPPALEEDPVTEAEYRTMLKSILGSKAMPAFDAAALSLAFTAPGPVIESGGGTLSEGRLSARIPVIKVLTLERPIELWLRWRQ
jgi:hypothetical protein